MTRDLEQTYLAAVKLPFDRRTNVTPYAEYLNVMVPVLDNSPTVREWQAGGVVRIGDGTNYVVTVAGVPAGFQDTYVQLTGRITSGSVLLDCRIAMPGQAIATDISFARLSVAANTQFNLLSNLQSGDVGRYSVARNLVLGPGMRLELHTLAAPAVAEDATFRFLRYREPGPVINQTEPRDLDITAT